ncbi:hypothetical protein [Hoeflea poritis]|uniref:Transposase DDE domain-containing protein n=1 Tax=Hoeflea poritis TaxID=2993659 RepID=A0ABT4VT65_9HYPH|nr:hypothetical protein [Hoeflea poritis]MDA4847907.1 hypothetical protein [Hoeflea poritis]
MPSSKNRKIEISQDGELCRQRHQIDYMFGKLKDWWRIATSYDRYAHTFSQLLHRRNRRVLVVINEP